ncbi:MAG: ECF transporter S component [Oscillospiraceae bacterium]|nr:ECF transporter S component [Oscillospiraceae bacterium]
MNTTNLIGKNGRISVRMMTLTALLSAISTVVMLFEFPLPFAPNFYRLDLSEIVVAIGAFTLGPVAGVTIELLKNLLNLLINGTSTAGVGEFANFAIGCAFIIPASVIYRKTNSFRGALIGLAVGTLSLVAVGSLMNYYLLIPLYAKAFNAPIDAFVQMGNAINKSIVDLKTLVLFATAPFNLVKGIVASVATLVSYKKLSAVLHK